MSNLHPNQQPDKTGLAAHQAVSDAKGHHPLELAMKYTKDELCSASSLLHQDLEKLAIALANIHRAIIAKGVQHDAE